MSKKRPSDPATGMPANISPELRQALIEELERMGATYEEAIYGIDPPPSPELVLKLIKHWNSLTPAQRTAWDKAAARQDPGRTDPNWPN